MAPSALTEPCWRAMFEEVVLDVEAALRKTLLAIPSINGGSLLARMLPTLRIPAEHVVVLDQGSDDDTETICRRHGVGLVQLNRPYTYTEACNFGARLARERGCAFLFVGNNDIAFKTDVVRECLETLLADPRLGVVAPSQIMINEAANLRLHAYRVFWSLDRMIFEHEFTRPAAGTRRLEADFCELTLVGTRISVLDEVGFLDDDFGFYHEDADFGFRLREKGYDCAYLPHAVIEHWTSSTFSQNSPRQKYYIKKNKRLFRDKHLGIHVSHRDHRSTDASSWSRINRSLHPHLRRMGMLDDQAPELIFAHPGGEPFDHLYTVWETSRLPESWRAQAGRYKSVSAPSRWCAEVLRAEGFAHAAYVPHGVDSDVFSPWGEVNRLYERKTFLWNAHNQHRKGLDVMLAVWARFHRQRPLAQLLLMGVGLRDRIKGAPSSQRRIGPFEIHDFADQGVSVYEIIEPLSDEALAAIYRGVDYGVSTARSEGFGFVIAEAMACGAPTIFGAYGGARDFVFPGALTFGGKSVPADYHDKGFHDVGAWWEPNQDQLLARLFEAYDLPTEDRQALAERGWRAMRRFSWRETCFALRRVLADAADREAAADDRRLSASGAAAPLRTPPATLFVGYAEGDLGLGQSFRDDVEAAIDANLDVAIYPFDKAIETRKIGPFHPELYERAQARPVNVIVVAPDQTPYVEQALAPTMFASSYNILRTYWELPDAPQAWRPFLARIDEIWVPNAFVADAFRDIFPRKIAIVPTAVDATIKARADRAEFGLEAERFYFLFSFDYFSSPYRKNPLAAAQAFAAAFPDPSEKVGLVIKSLGAIERFPEIAAALERCAAEDPRIVLMHRSLDRDKMLSLIDAVDCYLSLHRAEGFGAGMAEALLLGKPVIGTDFSGSRCFLDDSVGYPVPYVMRDIQRDEYGWGEGQVWADPIPSEAARLMRAVHDDPAEAKRRAEAGRLRISTQFSRAAVGAAIRSRLAELQQSGALDQAPKPSEAGSARRLA